MSNDRHNSASSSALNRVPTVQEDPEEHELSNVVWRSTTTSGIPSPPLRSQRGREGSASSESASPPRDRLGSSASLPNWNRRDSLAPSLIGSGRASPGVSPFSITDDATLAPRPRSFNSADEDLDHVETDERLKDFHRVEAMNLKVDPEAQKLKQKKLDQYRASKRAVAPTLEALRKYSRHKNRPPQFVGSKAKELFRKPPQLPADEKLINLAHHYFRPLSQTPIQVCDFGHDRAEHNTYTLAQVQHCWNNKPEWADVRWIHVPLGLGLKHSTVEDLFLHAGPESGRPFVNGGSHGWPYLTTPVLNLRSREHFQAMRDVSIFMKNNAPHITASLNKTLFNDLEDDRLYEDIKWRAGHVAQKWGFWDLAQGDMSWQLTESVGFQGMDGPHSGLKPVDSHIDEQILSRHPFFKTSQLVNDVFRCFHRSDGCLLTQSSIGGINYLERRHSEFLQEPPELLFNNSDASALGQVFKAFSRSGTRTWNRNTVEWFTVYLMTEIITTPHSHSQGHSGPALQNAYSVIVADLKRRRFEEWKRGASVALVKDFISATDELTLIVEVFSRKLDFLQRLRQDCEKFEAEDLKAGIQPNNPLGKTTIARIEWAIGLTEEAYVALEQLLKELKTSMSALFQLRSIEQNELAIVADSQNKAILLFTGVTIVFLPLSFFTSYFGMNLKGIQNTDRTEKYFWAVCGTVGLLLVVLTVLYAVRHEIADACRRERREEREDDEDV